MLLVFFEIGKATKTRNYWVLKDSLIPLITKFVEAFEKVQASQLKLKTVIPC